MRTERGTKRATGSASLSNYNNNNNNNKNNKNNNYYYNYRDTTSTSALSPTHGTSLSLAVLLLLSTLQLCSGAPVFLNPSTIQHDQLLSQIDNACSSYLSAEQPLRTSDVLWDFCGLMLGVLRKFQDLSVREPSKRSTVFHPLLQLIPKFHSRRRRRVESHEELQGPGSIQSRGYFLYRPRNGRRSTEYV